MPINSVCQYLKGQFDEQMLAGQSIEAHIMPAPGPLQMATTPPRVYIWPSDVLQKRETMAGAAGFFTFDYAPITFGVRWTLHAIEEEMEQFLPLVDAVWAKARVLGEACPIGITDAETGQQSDILALGELQRSAIRLPRRILTAQPVTLSCDISVTVKEWMQGP